MFTKWKFSRFIFGLFIFIYLIDSHALPVFMQKNKIMLEFGGYWRSQASSKYIYINDLIGDAFINQENSNNSNGLFGVGYFAPLNIDISQNWNFSYGLNWFYLPKTNISGVVLQENEFKNLTYAYNVTNYPLYIEAQSKFSLDTKRFIVLNAGIGPNFMSTSGFNEKSIVTDSSSIPLPDAIFSGKTTTTFSATAGAALEFKNVLGSLPLTCGYQFFYLGQGSLNNINNQVISELKTGTLYANAVLCSTTFF